MRIHLIIFVAIMTISISIPAFALDAETGAEYTMNKANSLTKSQIELVKSSIESEFGQKTVFRWDYYTNPRIRLYGKSVDSSRIKNLVSYFYYAADAASKNKYGVAVSPLLVYTIAIGEGFGIGVINRYYLGFRTNDDSYVDGWDDLGLDHFSSEIDILKAGGFLRKDFNEYSEYSEVNEKGENARTAKFNSMKEGLEALGARVAYAKWLFLKDAKSLGIQTESLTGDEMNFWTYYYFNRGSGKDKLQTLLNDDVFDDSQFIRARPGEVVQNGCNARHNAIIRTAVAKFIRELGIFA